MKRKIKKGFAFLTVGAITLSTLLLAAGVQAKESTEETGVNQFMDCFMPMPVVEELSSDCWGAPEVGKRDQGNGLEDRDMSDYCYWDGGIIKNEENGKYYLFASRWLQAGGHWGQDGIPGWQGSQAVYAVSDNLYGPYEDQGPIWPEWCDGAGHNVFPFELSKEDPQYGEYKYAISISDTGMHGETANGTIHLSNSLDGPWKSIGKMQTQNGSFGLSNISILVRPDGKYEAINRNGDIATADTIMGPWTVQGEGLWWKVPGMPTDCIEDPVIWYSEGLYHCVVNKWDARRAYYLTSSNGINDWRLHPGTAYTPDETFMKYENGVVNNWTKLERPNVYIEDGTLKAMTFAVIDVQKEQDFGNDNHGSKIVVVPFAGEKLGEFASRPDPLDIRPGILPIADTNYQTWQEEVGKNYGSETFMQLQKDEQWQNLGMGILGEGNRPNQEYDSKVGFLKYDLSEYDKDKEIESAYLSLVYKGKAAGVATTDRVQVTLADANWQEGTGNESENGNQADAGVLTANNQPTLIYDKDDIEGTTAISEEFSTLESRKEVKIDVTELIKQFRQNSIDEKLLSFAMNETETGNRLKFGSKEAGETYAPKLAINFKEQVTGITVNPTELKLEVGDTSKLTAEVALVNASNKKINWTSQNNNIAEVDTEGKVTAKAPGTTVVTVTTEDGSFEANCNIIVSAKSTDNPNTENDKNQPNLQNGINDNVLQTGDNTNVLPLIGLLAVSVAICIGYMVIRKNSAKHI